MRTLHMRRWVLGVVVLAIALFLGTPGAAQFPCQLKQPAPAACSKLAAETKPDMGTLSNETPPASQGAHGVALSWKASVSLSSPPGDTGGYNIYRLNPDCSCVRVNQALIKDAAYEDSSVKAGQTYRYGATAVKRSGKGDPSADAESDPSNVVEAHIPQT
jgi:hypothetical protein